MKAQSNLISSQSQTVIGKLINLNGNYVKEYGKNSTKTFHSVDLWNILRQGRTMVSRRKYF